MENGAEWMNTSNLGWWFYACSLGLPYQERHKWEAFDFQPEIQPYLVGSDMF